MAPRINIELLGAEDLRGTLSDAQRRVFPRANARALNKALSSMRTNTVRAIAQLMGTAQRPVRGRIKVSKATVTRQIATIRYGGRPFNLIRFRARQVKRGVSAAPWGRRRIHRHAFIVSINGVRVVMQRKVRGGERVSRMPIESWVGPGVPKTAAEDEIRREREAVMRDVYPAELRRQLELLIRPRAAPK